jgi:hypothetical protein
MEWANCFLEPSGVASRLYLNDSVQIMADDKSKRGPQDRSRISLGEDYEVRYWSEKFGVSAERLKAAVNKVGNSAEAVEKELRAA